MPCPFPGMDPYLEHPEFFPDLHDRMVTRISETLQTSLPAPYFTMISSRVWLELSQRLVEPDANVLRPNVPEPEHRNGGVATAVLIGAKPLIIPRPIEEHRQTSVELYTYQGGRRLVTHLEILSLSNKTAGSKGRKLYRRKQREVLKSKTNLVEIDLLRGGTHSTAIARPLLESRSGPFDYHICVRRLDDDWNYYTYPFRLPDRLPEIAIPLLPGDGAVGLDLQKVLDHCYEVGPYHRLPVYTAMPLEPLLSPEQAEWASRLLRSKGFLPPA